MTNQKNLELESADFVFTKIQKLEEDKENIDNEIDNQNDVLVEILSNEYGVIVGEKVKLFSDEIVVINKFFISYSDNYRYGIRYRDRISEEEFKEFTKREFALYAYCYGVTAKGNISKVEKPEYKKNCLENCKFIEHMDI